MKSNQIPPGSFGLRSYDWEILPNQSLDTVRIPTTRPKEGLRVRFQPL